jgi:two-component sensor histidine kinase
LRLVTPSATSAPGDAVVAETNHRIANNLSLIAALLRLHASKLSAGSATMSGPEAALVLLEMVGRIEAVAQLHRLLSDASTGSMMELGDYLRKIADSAVASLSAADRTILSHKSSSGCVIPSDQALSVGLIITEMLVNALKYAHPTGVPVKIKLGARRSADRTIVVEIADDGVGLPEGFDPNVDGGLGLHLVRSLAQQLGARLHFAHNSLGLCVRLLIPEQKPGRTALH